MPILPIVLYPDPILKKPTSDVKEITPEIIQLLSDMAETMYDAPGIGLAGPQVGVSLRICVVDVGDNPDTGRVKRLYKLINPYIVAKEGKTKYEEGCLSLPGIHEIVERHAKITVEALDENGEKISLEADDLLAICLQHEIDHLDGIIFPERLGGLKKRLAQKKLQKLAFNK